MKLTNKASIEQLDKFYKSFKQGDIFYVPRTKQWYVDGNKGQFFRVTKKARYVDITGFRETRYNVIFNVYLKAVGESKSIQMSLKLLSECKKQKSAAKVLFGR